MTPTTVMRFGYGYGYVSTTDRHYVYLKNARLLFPTEDVMRLFSPDREAFFAFLNFLATDQELQELQKAAAPDLPLQFVVLPERGGVTDLFVGQPNSWRRLRRRLRSQRVVRDVRGAQVVQFTARPVTRRQDITRLGLRPPDGVC